MLDNKLKYYLVQSSSLDPWYNLALEEFLLSHIDQHDLVFYIWQNEKTVVIGKNQNAWKECQWELLDNEGGRLARRLSGGGAVYHDRGNLNFTMLVPRAYYDEKRQLEMILNAIRSCGIEASFSGRNDLCVQGRKFSGTAAYMNSKSALQHGTLLVNSNLDHMARYLRVAPEKIRSKGVDSVQSRVINLSTINRDLTIAHLKQALQDSFGHCYGDFREIPIAQLPAREIEELCDKYAGWEWRFGASPDFDLELERSFDWGRIQLGLSLENGYIKKAILYSDAMDSNLITAIAQAISGLRYEKEILGKALETLVDNPEKAGIISDITSCL